MLRPLRLEIERLSIGSPAIIDRDMVKTHARIDFDDEDAVLDVYILDAIQWCENTTQRTIFRRACEWVLADFNLYSPYDIRLPRGKTTSVESVAYSSGGAVITLNGPTSAISPPGTGYQEDLRGDLGGVIMPARGNSWPSIDHDVPAPVVISFDAGWAAEDVPEPLMHAIYFAIADSYDLRGTSDFGPNMLNSAGVRYETREALVSPYRLTRIY